MANEQEPVTITNSVEVNADTEKLKTTPQNGVTIPAQEGGRENRPAADNEKQQPADEGR